MKFIDEALIEVEAGKGGAGCKSFRREKFVPLGGPDGGNGGNGGSVIVRADRNIQTLLDFKFHPRWKAEDGLPGQGSNKDGRAGKDCVIRVPVGTQIFRGEDQTFVTDLSSDGQEFLLAKGGRGGKGNNFFKSATNRVPEHFQPGEAGEGGAYQLSLKLVADVGLIGFPNAGKSTLISRISSARPKIADYPFTTLVPNLGVVKAKGERSFVVADIPGLIPGAHLGRGLGVKFLKHIERTRVLVHLIDLHQVDEHGSPLAPLHAFEAINNELVQFSERLARMPQIIALTKVDTLHERSVANEAVESFCKRGHSCIAISSVSGEGIAELIEAVSRVLWNSVPTSA